MINAKFFPHTCIGISHKLFVPYPKRLLTLTRFSSTYTSIYRQRLELQHFARLLILSQKEVLRVIFGFVYESLLRKRN